MTEFFKTQPEEASSLLEAAVDFLLCPNGLFQWNLCSCADAVVAQYCQALRCFLGHSEELIWMQGKK